MNEQEQAAESLTIRPCGPGDEGQMLSIINAAAEAYRDVIPADCWHEPYMPEDALASEIADGVRFSTCLTRNRMIGVMGVQRRHNVHLIRHAYVSPDWQGRGVGSMLLQHLFRQEERQVLIGTWRAADWALRFYERHGFACVGDDDMAPLLRTYWKVPKRQIATSVVLASPPLSSRAASQLMSDVRRKT